MKKFLLTIFLIGGFAAWTLYLQQTKADTAGPLPANDLSLAALSQPATSTPSTKKPAQTPVKSTPPPAPKPTPKPASNGKYVDGTYTGSAADAYYGTVQVQAVISGGKLTDMRFLQYPSDRRTSLQIAQYALPRLRQEAIQSQSANVSTISGATDDSGAFRQSLASALSQAAR